MAKRDCPSDEFIKRLSDNERTEVISYVNKEFDRSELVLNQWKQKLIHYYELYMLVQRNKHYEGMAKIFVPETLRAVETIVTKLYQIIFKQPDWYEYQGRDNNVLGLEDGESVAMTQLVSYQMEENHFKSRIMDALRQLCIAGLVVRKVLWDFEEAERGIGRDENGNKLTRLDTIRDTWTLEYVDLLTFQISDINVPYNDVQRAKWIGEQYQLRTEHISEKIKKGWFSRLEKEKLFEGDSQENSVESNPRQSQVSALVRDRLSTSGFNNLQETERGRAELKEMWGLIPCEWVCTKEEMKEEGYDEDDVCEGVIVTANDNAILKLEKNPFYFNTKPYVICPFVPKENEVAGMGVAEIGQFLQQELNDTRNQVMDNKTLILSTMWLKSRTSGIKNQDLTIRPNGVITTNDMEGLVPLRPPVVTGEGIQIEGTIKNDFRESVGAASNLQGIAQSGVDTATESTQINQESMGRLLLTAQLFCELILRPTLVMAEYLNYQFYDHIKVISIIGPNGVKFRKLSPKEIGGGVKTVSIKIALDTTENPAIIRQQFQTFIQSVMQMPPQLIQMHWKPLDKLYGMFFYGHKLNELYPQMAPQDPRDTLTPEDERDMVIAEQPCVAQPGADHKKYLDYLLHEFKSMQYGLNDIQFELFKKLIQSHVEAMAQEELAKHQQQMQQAALQAHAVATQMLNGPGKNNAAQGPGGGMINNGSTPNSTPYNQQPTPTTASLSRGLGT